MKPRIIITDFWTTLSSPIYFVSFTLGHVIKVLADGVELTEDTSSTVASNKFYFDVDTNLLYINIGGSPFSSQVVVTYELFFGTFDAHWYRDPLDDTTRTVYYEPLVTRSPQITSSASDLLSGFLPTFSGNITISNATQFIQEHIYASSFNLAEIVIYHYLDELTVANTKLVLKGYCREINADDKDIQFSVLDATSFFDQEYRNPVGPSFYADATFADLDPIYSGRPLRQVFGVVDGFKPVNIDYVADNDSVTTTDNKRYICIADESNTGTVSTTVASSPASTTTRTYLTSVSGFRVGDTFWNKTVTTKYGEITAVGANYIDHSSIGVANASGNTIERSFVGAVWVGRNENIYKLWYGRDYTEYSDATNKVIGFDINTAIGQADLGVDDLIYANDNIYCRIYGHKISETLSGGSFGSNSTTTGNKTNGIFILYHLLKTCLGLSEGDLNLTSFSSLHSSVTDEIGFAVPESTSNDFPTYKEIILSICQTLLIRLYSDFDGLWKISQTGPIGSNDKTIEDDEILLGSFKYNFSYQDILSRIYVQYAYREVGDLGMSQQYSSVTQTSTVAKNLHGIDRQKTFDSLHFISSEAQTLADRLSFYFGDRRGTCIISTKNRFFDTELDSVIGISRTRMPGYSYDSDTLRSSSFSVSSTQKSLQQITIELDDQKGIEDNSGDW